MRKFFIVTILLHIITAIYAQKAGEHYIKNISYLETEDTSSYRKERCKLDIYIPQDAPHNFKTLIWFHGGGLTGGEKEIRAELKGHDIAIVAPNYRLYPHCKNPEYTFDAAAAVAWTIKHIKQYGGDPSQIYVSGHSAGGYLALMLALDKDYLQAYGVDADSIKGYYPISGQCATHYTIRKERKISFEKPIVDRYAPLNNIRVLKTKLKLITGDRKLEQISRYEENLYLKATLEGNGNAHIPIYEMAGFNHNTVVTPACALITDWMNKE